MQNQPLIKTGINVRLFLPGWVKHANRLAEANSFMYCLEELKADSIQRQRTKVVGFG